MKRILVTVKTKSKRPGVVQMSDGWYLVSVAKPPMDGEANIAVVRALANHLNLAPSRIALVRGAGSHEKVFQIEEA